LALFIVQIYRLAAQLRLGGEGVAVEWRVLRTRTPFLMDRCRAGAVRWRGIRMYNTNHLVGWYWEKIGMCLEQHACEEDEGVSGS
jgi:hypothetical protein